MTTKAALLARIDRLRNHRRAEPEPHHERVAANDLIVGDRITFGGREVEVTAVDGHDGYIDVSGTAPVTPWVRRSGVFAVYFAFEQVEVGLPRPEVGL